MSLLSNIWLNSYLRQEEKRKASGMSPQEFERSITDFVAAGDYRRHSELYGNDTVGLFPKDHLSTTPSLAPPSLTPSLIPRVASPRFTLQKLDLSGQVLRLDDPISRGFGLGGLK